MNYSEARVLILEQWDHWICTQNVGKGGPTGRHSLKFFYELQDAKSSALNFHSRGRDKWQVIQEWLADAGRLTDLWNFPSARKILAQDRFNGRRPRRLAGRRMKRDRQSGNLG